MILNARKISTSSPFPDTDQSFDDRATHLQKNIYGSAKGQLRLRILQRDLDFMQNTTAALSVLDIGCGAGMMSEWACLNGHHVLACDSSPVMLDAAKSRIGEQPRINYLHATLQSLSLDKPVDMIFCHAVLEWLEDQDAALDYLSSYLTTNGQLSLMFYNAWAREMAQLVYGNFSYIDKNYEVRQRVKLSPHWPCVPSDIEKKLNRRGFKVTLRSGIRVFYDLLRHREHYQQFPDDILRHELRVSRAYPYWQMGRYVHFLAQKIDESSKVG